MLDEKLHLFVAEELTPGPAKPEPDEQLEPVVVPLADAIRMCLDGTIRDAKTITSLLLWERMQGENSRTINGRCKRSACGGSNRDRMARKKAGRLKTKTGRSIQTLSSALSSFVLFVLFCSPIVFCFLHFASAVPTVLPFSMNAIFFTLSFGAVTISGLANVAVPAGPAVALYCT